MSLKSHPIPPHPEETVQVPRVSFPQGNLYMTMRDTFGSVYEDAQFADLFPSRGQPVECPWRLAVVTIMQFVEDLTDRQDADAVRARIDWKCALSLPLDDVGFDFTVLIVQSQAEHRLFEAMLETFNAL